MARRIHPRHLRHQAVSVFTFTPAAIGGTWAGTATSGIRAQVEHVQQVVTDLAGNRVVTALVLRIPPHEALDWLEVFSPYSRVDYDGTSSWVIKVRPVWRHGRIVYFEVTTGEVPPRQGGWWVTLTLHRSAGRDRRGNPTPVTNVAGVRAIFVPDQSTEPIDRDQSTVTTASLQFAEGTVVASTDMVTIAGPPAAAAGRWQIVGDPLPHTNGVIVDVRRA